MSLDIRDIADMDRMYAVNVRGPILEEAQRMEAAGHRIMKLNIGNPAPFGFEAPDAVLAAMHQHLPHAQGYSDSKGIYSARTAVSQYYESRGIRDIGVDDVFIGNGVSEMITMVLQALVDDGDEILVPSPDYPLWTAASTLAGGKVVHYMCDEENDWNPSLEDIREKVTPRTKAIVVINPNNPTGAVYSREVLEGIADIAREHELMVLSDEIYDRVLYDGASHISMAEVAPDLVCITFNGLSKAYRVCGYRAGWMVVTGPRRRAKGFIEGLDLLSGTRLCANVPGQHAIQVALGGRQSIYQLTAEGGRLHKQRDVAVRKLREIPGISVVEPKGALYCFPKIDAEMYNIHDDEKFMLDLLKSEKILMVQGTGFNYPTPDHFRVVTLPWASQLENAIERLGNFLADYHQH